MMFIKANENKKHRQHNERAVRHFKLTKVNFRYYTNTFSHP